VRQIRLLAFPVGIAMVLISALYFVVLRFANPDMTATRAMLTFWPILASMTIGFVMVAWSMEEWR
jgi:TRAP-type mannitol/chloroaromatic compound transport system permease small subunit